MEGMDTPETLKTIRAPVVLKMTGSAMPKIYMFSKFIKICQGLLLATLAALKLCSNVSKKVIFQKFRSVIEGELAEDSLLVASPHA